MNHVIKECTDLHLKFRITLIDGLGGGGACEIGMYKKR